MLDAQVVEIKGMMHGVEAVTPQGKLVLAERLSTYKGEFGLRRREV